MFVWYKWKVGVGMVRETYEKYEDSGSYHDQYYKDVMSEYKNILLRKGYSIKTAKAYIGHIKRFFLHVDKPIIGIIKEDVDNYVLYLIQEEKSKSFVNQAVSSLKFFYTYVLKQRQLISNTYRPKQKQKLPNILSKNEVKKILDSIENIKHKTILMLVYSAGLRVGEVVSLKLTDIDSDRMVIKIEDAKGAKDRYTLLSAITLEQLREFYKIYKPCKWLFEGVKPGYHITERTVQRVFKNAVHKAGIKKPVTTHSLRHSFATHLLESGTDIRYIQELLGHKNSKTTEIYTHVSKRSIENIVNPLDNLF